MSKDLLAALQTNDVDVIYNEVKSDYGHDAFLLENGQMNFLLSNFLSEHHVGDVMKTEVPTICIDSTVKEAAIIMFDNEITHLPVVNDDKTLAGIVTAWDLSKSIVEDCSELREVMTKDVRTCKSTDEIEDIARLMKNTNPSFSAPSERKPGPKFYPQLVVPYIFYFFTFFILFIYF